MWEVAVVLFTHSTVSEGRQKSEVNWENREFSKKLLDYSETVRYATTINADSMHLSAEKMFVDVHIYLSINLLNI